LGGKRTPIITLKGIGETLVHVNEKNIKMDLGKVGYELHSATPG
jgi:hypothetical protein